MLNFFWHEQDAYSLTSLGFIWTHQQRPFTAQCVMVDCEGKETYPGIGGVCADWPERYA